jgi:hypothetical protein
MLGSLFCVSVLSPFTDRYYDDDDDDDDDETLSLPSMMVCVARQLQ